MQNSVSEWILLCFGALLGTGVGFHFGRTLSPQAVPQTPQTVVQTAEAVREVATPKAPPSECDHTDEGFHCVRFRSNSSADKIRVDIPGLPFDIGRDQSVTLRGIEVPQLSSRRECERIKAILAKKLVESVLAKATRIHLAAVANDESGLQARVQFDGVVLQDLLIGKGLASAIKQGSKKPDWCRLQ